MMTKTKSPLSRGLRVLYMLPLICLCIGLQAKTVNEFSDSSPLFILRQAWGEEREITKAEYDEIEQYRIEDIEVLKDAVAKEKYGERAANGVIVITMKRPQELDEIVVISYNDVEEDIPFFLVKPGDTYLYGDNR